MNYPERYRSRHSPFDMGTGNDGIFVIPHERIANYSYNVIASSGIGWDHVSVSLTSTVRKVERCPTWEEMCFIKGLFWGDEQTVVQFHPPKSEWVSNHPYCLHLWRYQGAEFPRPPAEAVGIKALNGKW